MANERFQRENKEIDKVGGRGFVKFPEKGRKRCRVLNLASPGDQVEACVNGVNFIIQHDSVVDLHPSQIDCLRNARIHTSEYIEDPATGKWQTRPMTVPRVMVEVLGDVPDDGPKRDKTGKFKKPQADLPPAEQIPGLTEKSAVISGRG